MKPLFSYEEFKRVSLIPFVQSELGYKVLKNKTTNKWVELEKDFRIIINTTPNHNGHWVAHRRAGQGFEAMTIIDLCLEEGMTHKEIGERFGDYMHSTPNVFIYTAPKPKLSAEACELAARRKLKSFYNNPHASKNYLEFRGIPKQIGLDFNIRTNRCAAIFPLYLLDYGKIKLCSTQVYKLNADASTSKQCQKNLPRGLSIIAKKNVEHTEIIVTESSIDALCYHAIHQPLTIPFVNRIYIATCGSLWLRQIETIRHICELKNISPTIAFDNDPAGIAMANDLAAKLKNLAPTLHLPKEEGKDWNEVLKMNKTISYVKNK